MAAGIGRGPYSLSARRLVGVTYPGAPDSPASCALEALWLVDCDGRTLVSARSPGVEVTETWRDVEVDAETEKEEGETYAGTKDRGRGGGESSR